MAGALCRPAPAAAAPSYRPLQRRKRIERRGKEEDEGSLTYGAHMGPTVTQLPYQKNRGQNHRDKMRYLPCTFPFIF